MNLTTATPVEIDTVLADLYDESAALFGTFVTRIRPAIFSAADVEDETEPVSRFGTKKERVSFEVAEAKCRALAEGFDAESGYRYSDAAYAHRAVVALDEHRAATAANREAQAPLHAEYVRRGRWTRAFLVLNTGGHVHSSMDCATCYPTTRYGWLPQESGKTEAEIVEGAGADACTVCYPTAPVASLARPRRTLHRTEVEAQQARDEKAAKKAAKEAKAAAEALIDPATGAAIKDTHGWSVKTERTATSEYVESAAYLVALSNGYKYDGRRVECETFVVAFLRSMAAKHGITEEEVTANLAKKVAARVRRDY